MNHHHESLDEAIDRVAAQLTMVPADPSLAGRIAERLDTHSSFGWPRLALASAAVVATGIAIVLFNDGREMPASDAARVATAVNAPGVSAALREVPSNNVPSAVAAVAQTTARMRARRAAAAAEEPLPEMRQLDSLASPVTIDVAMLPTDTLSIAPVDFAFLDVADLAVRDIDERDSPKE
jgi:hypothetical protein